MIKKCIILVEYTRYALGIVSEYLPQELVDSLAAKLNLPEPEKPAAKRQSEGRPGGNEPPNKKIKHEGDFGIIPYIAW